MVTDFTRRGKRLIENYEKGLQNYVDTQRANNDRRYQELAKVFEKAQADRATTSKARVKWDIRNMKAQWERRQEVLMGNIDAVLAACTE